MAKPEENHSKWTTPAMINDSDVKNCASNCVALSTVFNGDDSTKLIIAQKGYFFKNMRLRAFDGLKQHSEYTLTDEPDALIALNNGPCEVSFCSLKLPEIHLLG
uniref:BBS1 domain-containing protein n=1 Tax=Caenorhabditis tropicalis TaxID=1561998 RepID=A0A1I7TL84_9PELO